MKLQFAKLSGSEKAAILLMCLGEEATAKVFRELSDAEVRMISRSMMAINHVPADVAEEILANYKQAQQEYIGLYIRGNEFAQKAISKAGDKKRVDFLMKEVSSGTDSRPLETISMMQPRMVATLLEHEHPQTVALILSTQQTDHTGKILSHLPEDIRSDIMYRIAKIDRISDDVVAQIEYALQREIGVVVGKERQHFGGIDKVVDILSKMSKGSDRNILIRMEETDREVAETIRKKMFTFHDLSGVDNMAMQRILKEVNTDTLTLALKTATDELKNNIFNNISNRAAEMIREDLEVMGPKKLSEVEVVQQTIVKIALKLEDEGELVLPGRGGRDVLV
jgi:flagellar motor switch protein FliG